MNKEITYEELETIVLAYQDGNSDAAELLVKQYEGYFQQFLTVLCNRKYDLADKTQRNFISLFIKDDNVRKNIRKFRQSEYVRKVVEGTLSGVRRNLSYLDDHDLKNEMVCLFLTMASNHNRSGLFGGFVNDYFALRVFSLVVEFIKNGQQQAEFEVMYDDELIDIAHYDDIDYDALDGEVYHIHTTTPTEFDENWVNGYTCGKVFSDLSTYERRLIKWYYEWRTYDKRVQLLPKDIHKERRSRMKNTEDDIADLLGCSRKTVNVKRNDIKRRLQIDALDLHLIR